MFLLHFPNPPFLQKSWPNSHSDGALSCGTRFAMAPLLKQQDPGHPGPAFQKPIRVPSQKGLGSTKGIRIPFHSFAILCVTTTLRLRRTCVFRSDFFPGWPSFSSLVGA